MFCVLERGGVFIEGSLADPVDLDRNLYPGGRPHQFQRSTAADRICRSQEMLAEKGFLGLEISSMRSMIQNFT